MCSKLTRLLFGGLSGTLTDETLLPRVNVQRILSRTLPPTSAYKELSASTSLSTEIFVVDSLTGATTLLPSLSSSSSSSSNPFPNIFYDSESLAIIHRYKSLPSGLVSTRLWMWIGTGTGSGDRRGKVGEKMEEFEQRFNTDAMIIIQGQESADLMLVLNQSLVVRQVR